MPGRKRLMVEGSDDVHVMKHICGNHGIPHLDEVKPYGNVERLLKAIPVQVKISKDEGDVLGIVLDADKDLGNRWLSVRTRLIQAGFQEERVPLQPDPVGTVLGPCRHPVLPKVGIWVMPNNSTAGILEDFLQFLVPQPNALFEHATESVNSVPEQRFRAVDRSKALIHTWLAWQSTPGLPYGTAISAKFLEPDVPEARILAGWLKRLFC